MINTNSSIPLYYQLKEEIKDKIEKGYFKRGEKLPSEAEMVKQYGIGRLTIREALSHLVKEGYVEKQHGKGTFCIGTPLNARKLSVEVLLNSSDHYFIPYYMRGISDVLTNNSCDFVFYDTKDNTKKIIEILETILDKDTSGIIIQAAPDIIFFPKLLDELLRKFRLKGIPYIIIDNNYEYIESSYVIVDYVKGGLIATNHLIELGHKNIAGIFFRNNRESLNRKKGFLKALYQAGILKKLNIIDLNTTTDSHTLKEHIIPMLEGANKVTAAVCYNDEIALMCMKLIHQLGLRVPDDFSIIGFDDTFIAQNAEVPLTSICHPKEILARHACEKLIDIINGNELWPYTYKYQPEIVIRNSTGPKIK